nr:hypothetical protein [uncultured Cohaesibacter sp.]
MVDVVTIKDEPTGPEAPEDENSGAPAVEEQATSERPEWLPEKFSTPEDMAKAYAELETKLGSPKEEQPPQDEGKTEEGEGDKDEDKSDADKAKDAVDNAGLDFDKYSTEFNENGELSEASYNELVDGGIPKEFVDKFIDGQKALVEAVTQRMYDAAGGETQFQTMAAWASTNLEQSAIDEMNKAFESGDATTAELGIKNLKEAYEKANGKQPQMLNGKTSTTTTDVYESWAQVTKDMGKPEYKNDPAFRAKVEAKLAKSDI